MKQVYQAIFSVALTVLTVAGIATAQNASIALDRAVFESSGPVVLDNDQYVYTVDGNGFIARISTGEITPLAGSDTAHYVTVSRNDIGEVYLLAASNYSGCDVIALADPRAVKVEPSGVVTSMPLFMAGDLIQDFGGPWPRFSVANDGTAYFTLGTLLSKVTADGDVTSYTLTREFDYSSPFYAIDSERTMTAEGSTMVIYTNGIPDITIDVQTDIEDIYFTGGAYYAISKNRITRTTSANGPFMVTNLSFNSTVKSALYAGNGIAYFQRADTLNRYSSQTTVLESIPFYQELPNFELASISTNGTTVTARGVHFSANASVNNRYGIKQFIQSATNYQLLEQIGPEINFNAEIGDPQRIQVEDYLTYTIKANNTTASLIDSLEVSSTKGFGAACTAFYDGGTTGSIAPGDTATLVSEYDVMYGVGALQRLPGSTVNVEFFLTQVNGKPVQPQFATSSFVFVSTNDIVKATDVTLFPIPVSSQLSLKLDPTIVRESLTIVDATGRILSQQIIDAKTGLVDVEISNLASGTYYLVLPKGDKKSVHPFTVVR